MELLYLFHTQDGYKPIETWFCQILQNLPLPLICTKSVRLAFNKTHLAAHLSWCKINAVHRCSISSNLVTVWSTAGSPCHSRAR